MPITAGLRLTYIVGVSQIRLSIVPPLELQGVLFVPELRANLLSVSMNECLYEVLTKSQKNQLEGLRK